jgi:ATP-binding cassette subfamily F protein 3
MCAQAPALAPSKLRQILGSFGVEGPMQERPLKSLSGGERARVVLAHLSLEPSHGLILDEPTHHLDVETIESLMHALEMYEGAVILVSHSPSALEAFMPDLLLVFENARQSVFKGELESWLKQQREKQTASMPNTKESKLSVPAAYLEKKAQDKELRQMQKQAEKLLEQSRKEEKRIQDFELEMAQLLEKGNHTKALELQLHLKKAYESYESTVNEWFELSQKLEN